MKVSFVDNAHEAFYRESLEQARMAGRTPDSYFRSLLYLCGLCPDTRSHFHRLFDWDEWCIHPEGLAEGWQTGTTMKITRLAFNLWNGCGTDQLDSAHISPFFLPDELFCCVFQPYFFEAIRLRFPEYAEMEVAK